MLKSIPTGQDAQEDYLKQLLDQRTAHADFYGHLSTPSDFSDTPSVYSRSFFSPCPPHSGESPYPENGYTPSHDHISSGDSEERKQLQSNVHEQHHVEEDTDAELLSRMSVLGPKMRFHSRAPWETEEDALQEQDETASDMDRPPARSKFFNFGPSSPRFSKLSRPSFESTRSDAASKLSIEGTANKGLHLKNMVYPQTQGSFSNTSLGKTCNSSWQEGIRKLSFGRLSQSPTSTPSSPSSASSPDRHLSADANSAIDCVDRRGSRDDARMFLASPTPSEFRETVHPYANPDLIAYSAESSELPESPSPSMDIVISDSTATITNSATASSVPRPFTSTTLTPDTTAVSVPPRKSSLSTLHGRKISTPVAVVGHSLQADPPLFVPGVQKLPGWMEKANMPSFSLISLEEARAQRAKSIMRSDMPSIVTINGDEPLPRTVSESSNSVQDDQSPQQSNRRTRARSISASAKAMNALHHVVGAKREGETPASQANSAVTPGKSLKHKKSGFMRLFNRAQETQELGECAELPPVPFLPEAHGQKKVHRVPVPELNARKIVGAGDKKDGGRGRPTNSVLFPKRTPPQLSISPPVLNQGPATASDVSPRRQSVLVGSPGKSRMTNNSPHSAPAHVVEFPALQLRPISTLFSAQFAEHLAERSLTLNADTPRSASPNLPETPHSFVPSALDKVLATSPPGSEDQSAITRAVQEQMASAKLAWQRQIWELEGQVRDLRAEIEDLRATETENYCEACGRGKLPSDDMQQTKISVVNRPRARTGASARFGSTIA